MMGHRYQTVTWDKMEVGQLTFRISMGAYIGYVGRATCSTAKVLGVAPLRVVKSSGLAGFA